MYLRFQVISSKNYLGVDEFYRVAVTPFRPIEPILCINLTMS